MLLLRKKRNVVPFHSTCASPALCVSLQCLFCLQSLFISYFPGATRWCSWLRITQRPERSYSVCIKTDVGKKASTHFCNEGESCYGVKEVLFTQDSATKLDIGRKSWIITAVKNTQYYACVHAYTHIQPLLHLITMWILHASFLLVATMPSYFTSLIRRRFL